MDAVTEAEFREFTVASRPWLLRSAYLLTGEHARAEKLVSRALVRVHRRWHRGARAEGPERYALRALVTMHVSRVREWIARGEQAIDRAAERSTESTGSTGSAAGVLPAAHPRDAQGRDYGQWYGALDELRPRTRAVLVLGYDSGLPDAEIAELLGCSPGLVQREQNEGLRRLTGAADPSQPPLPRSPHPNGTGREG